MRCLITILACATMTGCTTVRVQKEPRFQICVAREVQSHLDAARRKKTIVLICREATEEQAKEAGR